MRRLQWIGLGVLCLLSGSRWLADNAYPGALPILEQQALHYLLIGLVAAAALAVRRRSAKTQSIPWPSLSAASLLLLGLPAILTELAARVTTESGPALFALAPLFVVVGVASAGGSIAGSSRARSLMMPSLIGLAGALLLLPFKLPSTALGAGLFLTAIAAVVSAAIGSVWMHRLLQHCPLRPALVLLCGVNAVFLGVASALHEPITLPLTALPVELLRAAALDLPQLLLLVWLLRELDPARLSARYLLAPLLTTLEGMAFFRLPVDLRMGAGSVLLLVGGMALLLWKGDDESGRSSSLNLR